MSDLIDCPRPQSKTVQAAPPQLNVEQSLTRVYPEIYSEMAGKLSRAYVKGDRARGAPPSEANIRDLTIRVELKSQPATVRIRDYAVGASMATNILPLATKLHRQAAFQVISKDMARVIADYTKVVGATRELRIRLKPTKGLAKIK